jgi:large subunit ribosomal protein L24
MRKIQEKPAAFSIRHGDTVKIMSGRSKGKTGKVLSVNPWKIKGGILEKEGPVHVSNVLLVCPGCGKHTRAGHTTLPDGSKVRSCRRCNTTFEN